MKEYLLTIYTYPPLQGLPCNSRNSYHDTPGDARSHLKSQTMPYVYATLQRNDHCKGFSPCTWDGGFTWQKKKWPVIWGTNREHPLAAEIREAWLSLLTQVREEHAITKRGMIYIAGDIMESRWPEAYLSEALGRQAAGLEAEHCPCDWGA